MLKSEDRKIREKSKRPFSENEVIENIYLKYGIYIRGYANSYLNDLLCDEFERSRHLHIPDEIIEAYLLHPETYGSALVSLDNGMITDIDKDDLGGVYSITNDDNLIGYVMMRERLKMV